MELATSLRQVWEFTKRDFHSWTTYKTSVVLSLLNIGLGVLAWGVMAMYRNRPVPEYNTDYISFLIAGIVIANVIMPMSRGLERGLNPWTLEAVLMSGVRIPVLVVGSVGWNYIFSMATLVPQLLMGVYLLNAKLNVDLLSTFLSLIVSMAIIFGLSMMAMGVRLVTKSRDPVTYAITMAQQFMAGMLFPVQFLDQILPGLSMFSWLLPPTWIYHIIRSSMLSNASVSNPVFLFDFLIAAMIAVLLFPVGYYTFRWGLKRAKKEGTLGWY